LVQALLPLHLAGDGHVEKVHIHLALLGQSITTSGLLLVAANNVLYVDIIHIDEAL
jgi:hypothetical protein